MSSSGIYEDLDQYEQNSWHRTGTVYDRPDKTGGTYDLASKQGGVTYDLASKHDGVTYDLASKQDGVSYDLASKHGGVTYDLASKHGGVTYDLASKQQQQDGGDRIKGLALYDRPRMDPGEVDETPYDLGDGGVREESTF
jgi:hypothetical protein